MLKPSSDRLDYGKLLAPPDGYTLAHAVGTTYSLDFDTLIGATLALGLSAETDSSLLSDSLYLLGNLHQASDKVTILCQAGQIHLPQTLSPLYILLEKVVYQVQLRGGSTKQLRSFHPKVWVIKYTCAQNRVKYRLIVLSRNLTSDRSWDVAVALDGDQQDEVQSSNQSIIDFVSFLRDQVDSNTVAGRNKRSLLKEMMDELPFITFETNDRTFKDFQFIPVGVRQIDGEKYSLKNTALYQSQFQELLIMSPFISAGIINDFNQRSSYHKNTRCVLITRREALTGLKLKQCDRFEIYTMKDQIVYGETLLSEENADYLKQDIHAKIYLRRRYKDSELYLGSANATQSAMNGNIEAVLRLFSENRRLNLNRLVSDLFNGEPDNPDNPFELTDLPKKSDIEIDQITPLEREIRQAIRFSSRAVVDQTGETFRITVRFKERIDFENLQISPLLIQQYTPLVNQVVFEDLQLLHLSEFYIFTATHGDVQVSRVVKIPTTNIPDYRESAVVTNIIQDTSRFFQYLAFVLGDNFLISALENKVTMTERQFSNNPQVMMPGLYENMLKTAAATPGKLSEIEYLMNMIDDKEIIPAGFVELYQSFRKALGFK